jgi:site-specific DNA-methyltransferase (adenine-specific)
LSDINKKNIKSDKMKLNKLYNIDCIEGMKQLPLNFIDLVVTSPPYNVGIDYDVYNDNKDWVEYWGWSKKWIKEVYRVLKEDGRFCLNVLVEMGINDNKERISPLVEFYNILRSVGFRVNGLPMWTDRHRVKYTAWGSWMSASAPYIYCPFEVVIIAYKGGWKKLTKGEDSITKNNFMMGCCGVWNIPTDTRQLTKANFPLKLPEVCIELLSYKNDIVLDPFAGAGTTLVAAKRLERKYLGFEISEKYCKVAEEEIKKVVLPLSKYL